MNAIAFSLYGNNPRYLVGAVENVRMAGEFYPGWEIHMWIGRDVPGDVRDKLRDTGVVVHWPGHRIKNGMFWRFLIHDHPGVERYLVRDVDSRFSTREVKAVNMWVASGTQLHIMRDHPYHAQPIMGGMFGWLKRAEDKPLNDRMQPESQQSSWGADLQFLNRTLLREAESALVHDSCGTFDGTRNWPSDGPGFVGEYIDPHGRPNEQHRQMRLDFLSRQALQPA